MIEEQFNRFISVKQINLTPPLNTTDNNATSIDKISFAFVLNYRMELQTILT